MASRPSHLDLRSPTHPTLPRPLKSPRLHVAGEVPPALSPLDAFAAQSRLLQKQLEDSAKEGRRMSRLPPLTTESPLVVQGRSEYFRSMSYDAQADDEPEDDDGGLAFSPAFQAPPNRPVSVHPRMSHVAPTPDDLESIPPPPSIDHGRQLERLEEDRGDFGVRREQSPIHFENQTEQASDPKHPEQDAGLPEPSPFSTNFSAQRPSSPTKLTRSDSRESLSLAPPRSFFPKRSSSIMSGLSEPLEDDPVAAPRKLSAASPLTGQALASPALPPARFQRSPSTSSAASASLPRPSFNFSRPLSRAGTPSFDMPSRQASSDSQPSFVLADDTVHTPISMHSDVFTDNSSADDASKGAPSYIYAKYSLPRGKSLQRNSAIFNSDDISQFSWEQPITLPSNVQPFTKGQAPPSPPSRPSSSLSRHREGSLADSLTRPSLERSKLSHEVSRDGDGSSPVTSRPSTNDDPRASEDTPRGRSLGSPMQDQVRGRTPMSVATSDSASTVKPPKSTAPTAAEMSAEEHLDKGIKLHEEGALNESTYHLRLAAHGGSPTGMLLYALACRHGWGMRKSEREGVGWLRKAAEFASVEIAEDEDQVSQGKKVDTAELKSRKAQFALSIYELGVSHMNGWGIEQDKALALRCYEIAGNWGDVDALAEAGFCYAQGIGCKKDLKKSAKFYRMAEAKGMNMPGNSWIHKPKYADDASDAKSKKGRARSKSRSRNIFGKRSKEQPKEAASPKVP